MKKQSKKQIILEFINENSEESKNEKIDSDLENEFYEQDFDVKSPKIPESLKTPEPSQKQILEIRKKPQN